MARTCPPPDGHGDNAPRWKRAAGLSRHPLVAFFLLAYSFSWFVEIALIRLAGLPAALGTVLATAGPTVAAVVMILVLDGRAAVRRLLGHVTFWRVGIRWYLITLLGIPLVYLFGTLVLPDALASFRPATPLP